MDFPKILILKDFPIAIPIAIPSNIHIQKLLSINSSNPLFLNYDFEE